MLNSIYLATAFWAATTTNAVASPQDIVLGVRSSVEINAPAGAGLFVADGLVVKAVDMGRKLRLTGRKVGVSEVRVGDTVYLARVLPVDAAEAYVRIAAAIDRLRGLRVEVRGAEIWIRGRLLRARDWSRLVDAGEGTPFRMEVEIEPSAVNDALSAARKRLAEFHLPEPALSLSPRAIASISPDQADLKPRYEAALKPWGFTVETNASVIAIEPLVRVNILVAELKRSFGNKIGVSWPTEAHAQLLPALTPFGSAREPAEIGIHALEQSGEGKVLASPNILCRSGKEALFFAGGEFPIKVIGFRTNDVTWKKYGVSLKVKPKADVEGRMSVGLETEVSALDRSTATDGIPGIFTNRIESHFDLRGRRTIALSGLIKKDWGDSIQGLPGLTRLPILGRLFGSRDWNENKTELVVFVTPEVIDAAAEERLDGR